MRYVVAALLFAVLGLLPPLLAEAPEPVVVLLLILFSLRSSWLRRGGGCSSSAASAPGQASSSRMPAARPGVRSGGSWRSGRVQGRATVTDALAVPFWRRAGVR